MREMAFEAKIDEIVERWQNKLNDTINSFMERINGEFERLENKEEVGVAIASLNKGKEETDREDKENFKNGDEHTEQPVVRKRKKKEKRIEDARKKFKLQKIKKRNFDTWLKTEKKRRRMFKARIQTQELIVRIWKENFKDPFKLGGKSSFVKKGNG